MANLRAIALESTGFGNIEVADSDVLLVGNLAPSSGDLTIGGAGATDGVVVTAGHDFDMLGDSILTLAGTGNLNITATGTHAISGGTLDVNVASDFSGTMTLSGGADLVGTTGSTLTAFDSLATTVGGTIGGIVQESLVDKTATELITGQWTLQAANTTNPKMVVKAAGGEAANAVLFQVQTSAGANLFSVDVEGDVVIAGGETVAGTTIYTGNVTLGDGSDTIQLGSAATPAQGDNVYIDTTGTTDGVFTLTTANINVIADGTLDTDGGIIFNDGGTLGSTNNGDIAITANGTGVVNVSNNLNAQAGLDVTGALLTVDSNGIDSAGNIDLAGTLSFDAAGTIDTSGNNNLTLSAGTASILATAGTVDLRTNVTTLDVPTNTGFSIGGTALTSTLWTATAVDIVFGGVASNADAYHTHTVTGAADQIIIDGLTTAAMSQYQAGYVSSNLTVTPTDCSSASGSYQKATFSGVYDNSAGEMVNAGKITVQFDAALTVAAGNPAILSYTNAGQFTNVPPAAGTGHYLTRAGIILDTTLYATVQRCVVLLQPERPIKR